MVLTGLSTEQKFDSHADDPVFYLVFNDGELRIPITASSTELVIKTIYGSSNLPGESRDPEPIDEDLPYSDDDVVDDIGVPQA